MIILLFNFISFFSKKTCDIEMAHNTHFPTLFKYHSLFVAFCTKTTTVFIILPHTTPLPTTHVDNIFGFQNTQFYKILFIIHLHNMCTESAQCACMWKTWWTHCGLYMWKTHPHFPQWKTTGFCTCSPHIIHNAKLAVV